MFNAVSTSLNVLAVLVQVSIVAMMMGRKIRAAFPLFFAYNIAASLVGMILIVSYTFLFSEHSHSYFWIYWGLNALIMAFEFGVMYEVFVSALKPYDGLIDLGKLLFRWAAVFLFIAAILTAIATNGGTGAKCVAAVALVERGIRLMQCGLLLLFFLFERRLGLSWRSRSVSIALGLGACSALTLCFAYMRMRAASWAVTLDLLDNVQYVAVAAFWAVCLYLPEPARKNVLDSPSKLIFQRWNEALMASPFSASTNLALASNGLDCFLPSVERTVERVLSRKMVQ